MRVVLLYVISIMLTVPAISQNKISSNANNHPYMLIDSFEVDAKFFLISPDKIESIDVFKDSNAVKMYGNKATHGAIIVKTKPNTKLLRIKDIIDKYNTSGPDKQLRVCINKTVINHPELIVIEPDEILGIEIITDRNWINVEDANSTERFINIKTPERIRNSL
jgi:hypothetical protein